MMSSVIRESDLQFGVIDQPLDVGLAREHN